MGNVVVGPRSRLRGFVSVPFRVIRLDRLMPAIFGICLFPIKLEQFEHGRIRGRKQDCILCRWIEMFVPAIRRQDKEIPLLPIEFDAIDNGRAPAAKHVIYAGIAMPMRPGVDARPQHLYPASDGGKHMAAGGRVGVIKRNIVKGIRLDFSQTMKRLLRFHPRIGEQR